MSTKLVSVVTEGDVVTVSRFLGKVLDSVVRFKLSECGTKEDLFETIEDFRLNGLPAEA